MNSLSFRSRRTFMLVKTSVVKKVNGSLRGLKLTIISYNQRYEITLLFVRDFCLKPKI